MLEKIILYYKRDLSSFKLVFKDIMWIWWIFIISSIISGIGFAFTGIINWHPYIALGFIAMYFITFFIVNSKVKKELVSKYGIVSDGFLWGGVAYHEMRLRLMKTYLDDNNLDNEKIKMLIELLYKRSKKNQPAGLVGTGLLLAIFVPLWTQFLSWLFKSTGTFEQALYLFISILIILLMIVMILRMIQVMVIDIVDKERETLKNIASMLEEILIT